MGGAAPTARAVFGVVAARGLADAHAPADGRVDARAAQRPQLQRPHHHRQPHPGEAARLWPRPDPSHVNFDGQVSGGNQWGTVATGAVTHGDTRLIDGQLYIEDVCPAAKWSQVPGISYLVICPVFGLDSVDDLAAGRTGHEERAARHPSSGSTSRWNPDISRLAMMDLSALYIKPDDDVLDLWATSRRNAGRGHLLGVEPATDGTKLVDIEVSYTFSQVGVPQTIDVPGPSWTPSPPDASAEPVAVADDR